MTYTPAPFPWSILSMAKLRDWMTQELAKVSAAVPGQLVIDATDKTFSFPFNSDQDATPAFEDWHAKVPDGSLTIFPPSYLTIKQECVLTSGRRRHIASLRVPVPGVSSAALELRYAPSQNGGRMLYLRSCDRPGFHHVSFLGGAGETTLVASDESGVNHVTGTAPFFDHCYFEGKRHTPGAQLFAIAMIPGVDNQEFARFDDCEFYGDGDAPLVGGRYDRSDACAIDQGSDVLTVNGPFGGPGNTPTLFVAAHQGWTIILALGPDGKTQHSTTIAEVISPTSVRLAAAAPVAGVDAYFAMVNASLAAVTVGQSWNSMEHQFNRCTFQRFWCGIQSIGGSLYARHCNYYFNTCNLAVGGAQSASSMDEHPTSEHSLQHLRHAGWESFALRGPARLSLSRPMPAAPFIAFGDNSILFEMDHVGFGDRPPLPKGSALFDLTHAHNVPTSMTPVQLLLRSNNYSSYRRTDLGLDRAIKGPGGAPSNARVRRLMEVDGDGLVFDQTIDTNGITGG